MAVDISVDELAAQQVVELGNRLAEDYPDEDMGRIADGLLSGIVHYWLYTRQPCEDPRCPDCAALRTPEWRLAELQRLVEDMARTSDYFESPEDMQSGSA